MEIRKKRINDLAIVVINGKIYSRSGVDDKDWIDILEQCEAIEQATCLEEWDKAYEHLLESIDPKRVAEKEAKEKAIEDSKKKGQLELDFETRKEQAKRIADISDLFEYDEENFVYLKGFSHPINKIMAKALLDANYNPDSRYTVDSLINFWKFLMLNPDKHVRNQLFEWINTSKFAITEEGNIIAYRNVDVKKESVAKDFEDFISESWLKVKKWKKSPKNYSVTKNNGELKVVETSKLEDSDNVLGVLSQLYADVDTEENTTVYTDQHTHTMEIRLNKPVSMPRESCDNDPESACSRGLHAKSNAHWGNFGSESIVMLVNPWNVVAVPKYDNTKFRCCEYLPVAKAEVEGNNILEFDPGTYDIPYNGIERLTNLLKSKTLQELQKSGEISKELGADDFDFIIEEATQLVADRVINVT